MKVSFIGDSDDIRLVYVNGKERIYQTSTTGLSSR